MRKPRLTQGWAGAADPKSFGNEGARIGYMWDALQAHSAGTIVMEAEAARQGRPSHETRQYLTLVGQGREDIPSFQVGNERLQLTQGNIVGNVTAKEREILKALLSFARSI